MTLTELNKNLTSLLKKHIKKEGFVDSGNLLKSIEFNCKYDKKLMDLTIAFNTNDYIQYLDDGKFLDEFFEKDKVKNVLEKFLSSKIEEFIVDSL